MSRNENGWRKLSKRTSIKVSVHVNTAERPFNRVYFAILVAIQFLEMIMREVRRLGMGHTGSMSMGARIISLRIFENTIMNEIRSWLRHEDFARHFLGALDDAVRFPSGSRFNRRKRLGLRLLLPSGPSWRETARA